MYQTGLELQQKLDKIIDYDQCNGDSAKSLGKTQYCKQLFKDQKFFFFEKSELDTHCDGIESYISKN